MTHPYLVRVNGRYAGLIFAERCVLKDDTYRLWIADMFQVYLERDAGIEVAPEPGSKTPAITIEAEEPDARGPQ